MKRLAAAATTAIAALLWEAGPAAAQIPVTCTSCPTEIQEALRFGKQIAEYGKQLNEIVALKQRTEATYNAFTNIRDLGSAVGALQQVGISNPLPVNPYAAQALMQGHGGAQGMLGSIGGLYTSGAANNTVFQCDNGSWVCGAMERWRNGASGTQALSSQLYASAADRAPQIQALQAQIAAARTPAEREALIAQLTAATAATNNQLVQAVTINTYGQQQAAQREQQGNERLQQSMAAVLEEARSRGYVQ